MTDAIILIGIILLSLYGLKTVVSHTKGEGSGCCDTSDKPLEIKKKHSGRTIHKMIFEIDGMTCDHCRIRVQNELNSLQGVVAHVDLRKRRAVLECEEEINEKDVICCIERIGYHACLLSK